MPADQNTSFQVTGPFSLDNKYTNIGLPWSNIAEVLASPYLDAAYRHKGLTVLVGKREYWFRDGVLDSDLVLKDDSDTLSVTIDTDYTLADTECIAAIVIMPTVAALVGGIKIGTTAGAEDIVAAYPIAQNGVAPFPTCIYANGPQTISFSGITGTGATVKIKIFKY